MSMCGQADGFLRLNRECGTLHGFVACGCEEREVEISAKFDQADKQQGISYTPNPNLRGNAEFLGDPSINC